MFSHPTPRLSPRKTKASVLCLLFLLSLFSNLSLHTPTTAIAPTAPSMNSGESLGLHSSSAIPIGEMTNVTFDVSEAPYRWFSTTGQISGITHLNITANTSTNDSWETGSITAYTAADLCVSSVFYVGYGIDTQCSNPSLDPTILFSIDFFDSQEMMSVLEDNLSFTITVEQHVEDTAPPSIPLPYNYSDGDINSDSSTWSAAPLVFLDEAPSTMVGGYFESEFDTDTIRYQTNYSGTHRLNVSINQQVNPSVFDELSDCQISDSGGHQMVKDINEGWYSSSISELTAVGNTLYFRAEGAYNGIELWKSDGTEAGTMMVKDIYSGSSGSSPSYLTAVGNTLYFTAYDGTHGNELWKSDGTEAGTMMVKDIYSGGSGSSPAYFTAVGNTLYFQANDGGNGAELWKSDGTEAGTMMVKDINSGGGYSFPQLLTAVGNTLYFRADDGPNAAELWKSDGTPSGTMMVKDINSGWGSSSISDLTAVGNTLYFRAHDGTYGAELWKSDGTEAGTMMVKDINSGGGGGSPSYLTAVGNTLYFQAYDGGHGWELWKSDGTEAGTMMVKDINSGGSSSSPVYFTVVGNTLFFQANDGFNGAELWKSDGTEAGTMMVKDIYSGGSSSSPSILTAVGNTLYFQANDGGNGAELWKSDGTEAGTIMVKDINIGSSGSSPSYLTAVGNTLYFSATGTGGLGSELHSYKEPNGQPQTFIDCLVTSVNGMAQFSFSPLTPISLPTPWIASITFEQVHPLEDPARGDSDGSSLYPPLLDPTSVTDGVFNSFGDSDRFAIPIQHGTMQSIQIHTQSNSVFSLLSSGDGNCFSDPAFITVDPSSSFNLESEWVSNTFICDTRYFTDEIQFQISQTTSGGVPYLPYQITLSTSNLQNISSSAMGQSIFDPPARGIVPVLNVNENVNGSFLHWSDQTDRYEIQLEPDASAQVQFLSNCATMAQYSGKNSVLEILTLSQASPIIIQRLQSSNIHDADLKDTCTYSLQVSEYTPEPVLYSTYSFTYDGRFHPTHPIQISNISEYLPSHIVSNDISTSVPFDLLPTTDGIIHATQTSGNPVTLQLSGTQYRGSEIGNMSVGQHIDFGSPRVQWTTLTLSGLDGSELQVQFTEQNLLTYTKESSELYSMGNGALGSSLDEGWDGEDTFTLNNSASMATFASVQISTLSEGFKASFAGSSISQLLCFDTSNPMAQILHQQGDGEYTLNVARGFTSCPSVSLYAPTTVSESSQFTVQYTDWNNDDLSLTVKLFDENLNLIYQNFDTNPIQAIELPAHVTEGMYHLLLVDESNIVYAERKLHVVHDPLQFVQPTKTILDVNEAPQILIHSFMHHSGEPVDWTFTNITLTTISQTGAIITQSLDEEYTGLGAKVVTLTNLPEVMPGSILHVQADLYAGEEVTKYSLSWKKVFFEPSITCETELIPDQTLPENDVLCLVSLNGNVHGGSSNGLTEFQVEGTLDIFDEQFELIQQIDFSSNLFRSTPIRIDSIELGTGHFFAKVNVSSTANLYLTEEVEGFEIGSFISSENESQQILGTYDLTIISIRDTALAGDDIVLTWQTTGEETAYFLVEVYGDNDIVQTLSLLNDGSTNGNFKIKLPNDVNPYMAHSITVHAYSTYGSVDSKSVNIQGMNQQTYLDVNINPDRPKLGSNFNVELLLSTDDSWLSWNWALYKSSHITPSDILSEGNGFELDNSAKFSVHLPLSQYTSSPYLHLEVESEDGSLFYETIRILPLPLRSITLDMDSEMILDKMYDVEWKLEGQYLNTLDNVERIEFAIYSMDNELYLEEVYSVNTTNGEFETRIPSSLTPGSHFVLIEFTFADGDTYEHSQIITVLSDPPGINIFALNIPPLALGLDTILVVILIGHAVFLHRRSSKKQQRDDTVFSDEHLDAEDKEIPEFTVDYEDYGEIDSVPEADEYPMYQEHPAGSGHHWVKYSSELEWEYIEI